MAFQKGTVTPEFEKALEIGRPPNIVRLFPNSRALIVSGKVIDRALMAKGKAMTIAANGRAAMRVRSRRVARRCMAQVR